MNPNQIQPEDVDPNLLRHREIFRWEILMQREWLWEIKEISPTPLRSHFFTKGNREKPIVAYACINGRKPEQNKIKGRYTCLFWLIFRNDPDIIPERGFMGRNDFFKPVPVDRVLSFFVEPVPDTRD